MPVNIFSTERSFYDCTHRKKGLYNHIVFVVITRFTAGKKLYIFFK